MAAPGSVLGVRGVLKEAVRTKAGLAGFSMLAFLLALVVAVPFYAPYDVIRAWGSLEPWLDNPRFAEPEWVDAFSAQKQPRTLVVAQCATPVTVPISNKTGPEKCPSGGWSKLTVRVELFGNLTFITMARRFTFTADAFPSEMRLNTWALFGTNASQLTLNWSRPDGTYLHLFQSALDRRAPASNSFPISQMLSVKDTIRQWARFNFNASDSDLIRPEVSLFATADENMLDPRGASILKGEYTITLELVGFGGDVGFDAKAVVYGTVFGIAGTDDSRRDLLVGLLWGAPVALSFATVAAVVIVLMQILLGAIATWYGGWFDELIQRASDLLLILPILPILILISIVYSPGIWAILFVLVMFGIVGNSSKIARSIVLQVKEEPYIEAAISYGANRRRILFRHILPRLLPYTFALIALSVPSFIFLEASLSFLGLGDPLLPTWGSILGDAYTGSAPFRGFWWWIAFPAAGIVFATVAFALLGYSFDKVLNPRLREE
ncbi:MAG: hypothetical protein A3K68_01635 [Euryarchaeota archaeon RBG_16_68_13]|nr:MAG: hypothetical protein A3K68_01635 [Euryarchaeota archaeon RBG_16_68_13]